MEERSSRDLLSDLPLSMIHCILECVPIRDAVKTSILSSQWRYKWATLPHLVFDDESVSYSGDYAVRLKNCITETLFLHQGPIHKFKLKISFMEICHNIHQWLLFLSRNDIRILILNFDDHDDRFHVHSSLYSFQNLSHLELFGCEIPPPPRTFNGFLYLKCLVLHNVQAEEPSSTIESLVANSPLLEELTLDCSGSSEMRIHAPNLKCFYFTSYPYRELSFNLPLLVKLSVRGMFRNKDFPAGHLQQKSSVCNYTKFFGSLTNLEELTGDYPFLEYLSVGFKSFHSSLVLHHLRVIKLHHVCFHIMEVMPVFAHLIMMGAPNLHKLIILNMFFWEHSVSFWDSESAPNFTFERLKVVEMENVEMKLIKFLLAKSPALETMIYRSDSSLTDKQLLNLTAELLTYRRASTNAQILFSNR